jgi:putative copper resistance protein D
VETALVVVRLIAFAAGAALFGAPLFALYSRVAPPRLRGVAAACAGAGALAAAAGLVIQTGQMAGDPKAGLDPATLRDAMAGGGFGLSVLARVASGLLALLLALALRPGARLWGLCAGLGGVTLAALPWTGHGAADEGAAGLAHLLADIAHLLAAGVWLGALAAFVLLLRAARPDAAGLHRALAGFSGVGSAVVAVIVATGLANSWFLVGPRHVADIFHTAWGQLLLAKLALFAAMLGLAALNRYRLTPALEVSLGARPDPALAPLRRSIALESALALAVLALVAVLGVQPPPTAG